MARSIDDKQARHVNINWKVSLALGYFLLELVLRKQSGSNLLGNSTSLSFLNVGSPNFIEQGCLTSINVAENAADWAAKLSHFMFEVPFVILEPLFIPYSLFFVLLSPLFQHLLNLLLCCIFLFLLLFVHCFKLDPLLLKLLFVLGLHINS